MDTIVTAKLSNPIYSDYWSVSLVMLYHAFNTKCKKDVLVWELACTRKGMEYFLGQKTL